MRSKPHSHASVATAAAASSASGIVGSYAKGACSLEGPLQRAAGSRSVLLVFAGARKGRIQIPGMT